jgi:hypothetical protein
MPLGASLGAIWEVVVHRDMWVVLRMGWFAEMDEPMLAGYCDCCVSCQNYSFEKWKSVGKLGFGAPDIIMCAKLLKCCTLPTYRMVLFAIGEGSPENSEWEFLTGKQWFKPTKFGTVYPPP